MGKLNMKEWISQTIQGKETIEESSKRYASQKPSGS